MVRKFVRFGIPSAGATCTPRKRLLHRRHECVVEISADRIEREGKEVWPLGHWRIWDQKTSLALTHKTPPLVASPSIEFTLLKFYSLISRLRVNLAKISETTSSSRPFQFPSGGPIPFLCCNEFQESMEEIGEGGGPEGEGELSSDRGLVCMYASWKGSIPGLLEE